MKKHCISYLTESLIFCKLLLSFRIKQELTFPEFHFETEAKVGFPISVDLTKASKV